MKLIEYNFSALRVFSNPCVGPLPRIKMSFFLLSISLPIEKDAFLSNPIPYPEYPYLSISVLLVNLTDPNKQFLIVG